MYRGLLEKARTPAGRSAARGAAKAIYLTLMQAEEKWRNAVGGWRDAKMQFAIQFGERFRFQD